MEIASDVGKDREIVVNKSLSDRQFTQILRELASISVIAFSLKNDLSPLSPEDIQMGAEPLNQGQIQGQLDDIQSRIASLALVTLGASKDQWYAANDGIQ